MLLHLNVIPTIFFLNYASIESLKDPREWLIFPKLNYPESASSLGAQDSLGGDQGQVPGSAAALYCCGGQGFSFPPRLGSLILLCNAVLGGNAMF